MKYDASTLTFCVDYPLLEGDHIARIPSGITTKDDLCAAIQRQMTVPTYFTTGNWDQLFEVLRFPDFELPPGASRSGRTVFLHQDIPLLDQDREEARTYLEILIDSILYLQQLSEKKIQSSENGSMDQLIAVFPLQLLEKVSRLVIELPDWKAEIGMYIDYPCALYHRRAPDWTFLLQCIERLDGLTVEYFELFRKKYYSLNVTYLRQRGGYYITYAPFGEQGPDKVLLSSPFEHDTLDYLLPVKDVYQIVRYVYENGNLPQAYQWYPILSRAHALEQLVNDSYYASEEEIFVELPYEMMRLTIYNGMQEVVEQEDVLLTIQEWRARRLSQKTSNPSEQSLVALCVLGMDNIAEMYDTFLALLNSPNLEERWISARFLGLVHDEKALPVLLSMLTEEWQIHADTDQNVWRYQLRYYAPRLLRRWEILHVQNALYQALQIWLTGESSFDDDDSYDWMLYEASLCYELGYRDAFDLVLTLPLSAPHHKFLLISMAQGYYTRSHQIGYRDEARNFALLQPHTRAVQVEILAILETKCHVAKEDGQVLLDQYYESSLETDIPF